MNRINILHLSDIHFERKANNTFRDDVKEKMLKKIRSHLENEPSFDLDFVAVTGDIAFSGKKKEYEEAESFFNELKVLLPDKVEFLIVPGNHDIDRKKKSALLSLYTVVENKEKTDQLLEKNKEIAIHINPKFKAYQQFAKAVNPNLYGKSRDYFWVKNFSDKNVSFLGLNSCWACEGDNDRNNITLGYPQVRKALKQATADNKILLMHHPPVNWFNEEDFKLYCDEIYNDCTLILHGHTHWDLAREIRTPSHSYVRLAANASYTRNEDGFLGFQFVRVTFEEDGIDVRVWPYRSDYRGTVRFVQDTNRYDNQNGRYFDLGTRELHKKSKVTKQEPASMKRKLKIPQGYKEWVKAFHSNVDIDFLAQRGEVLSIGLPEIYIPIETEICNHAWKHISKIVKIENNVENDDDIQLLKKYRRGKCIDIEILAGVCNIILLMAEAGMGKTTLVKHLTYTITHQYNCHFLLKDFLPVMVFFKDFWLIYQEELRKEKKKYSFDQLLPLYLQKIKCPLNWETISDFLGQHRVMFLLDGLDEIPEHIRSDLIEIIAQFYFQNKTNRFLLTGRPYVNNNKIATHFGHHTHNINSLDDKKVKYFISRWFHIVSGRARGLGNDTSEEMIKEIYQHENISRFTENPLLLTAVCILYQDGKRLPEQRADLYNRIIRNLIYRRFQDPVRPERESEVLEFLMEIAFVAQEKKQTTMDIEDALKVLKKTFPIIKGERQIQYNRRIYNLFDEIEPKCGLFNRLSYDKIEFKHLSYQEFLAASYMVDMDINFEPYLKKKWWRGTLLLYIGLISLYRRKVSNEVVKTILTMKSKNKDILSYPRFMGLEALLDFQPTRRDEKVVSIARQQLYQVIERDPIPKNRFEAGCFVGKLTDTRTNYGNFVLIPEGNFIRGANAGGYSEKPQRNISLKAYMIGGYPVTNQEFKRFVDNQGYLNKNFWSPEGWQWRCDKKITEPEFWFDRRLNGPNFPVVGVSWFEAEAYINWLDQELDNIYHLPTEAEWEKAARGPDGNAFTWGNKFNNKYCNLINSGLEGPCPVGIFPKDKSLYGCFDMIGNVSEWCSDWFGVEYYKSSPDSNPVGPSAGSERIVRGGAWNSSSRDCRATSRKWLTPTSRNDSVGFRLAKNIPFDEAETVMVKKE